MIGKSLLYTVKPGETIWSIAHKFDVNPGKMITANRLKGLGAVYSGQNLIVPDFRGKFRREILTFISNTHLGNQVNLPPVVTSISPCWMEMNEKGSISDKIDIAMVEEARRKQIKVYIHVQSFNDSGDIADRVLEKTHIRHNLITNLQEILDKYQLAGVNLHLRNVASHNRDYLTRMVQEMTGILRSLGYGVMVTLPAKTGDTGIASWTAAYDYHNIGKSADYIVIEAYDFHWADGHPGPIAPIFWVKDVLDYAVMEVAEEKIILGIPSYGYDWVVTQKHSAQFMPFERVVDTLKRYDAQLMWDEDAGSPYFNYFAAGEEHQVWFENCDSMAKKVEMVKKYHLGGLALANLGYEDPEFWNIVQKCHLK